MTSSWPRAIAACALALLLGACARPIGDLGIAKADLVHDDVLPTVGKVHALLAGDAAATMNETDEEIEMRNRIWRFLVAQHAHDWFYDVVAEIRRTGLSTAPVGRFPVTRYYDWLQAASYQSATTRYTTLGDDVAVDIEALPDTFAAICAVDAIDRQRALSASRIAGNGTGAARKAADRATDNAIQVNWFVAALDYRYVSYSYALDHLLVDAPHVEARDVDAGLASLAGSLTAARNGTFCNTPAAPAKRQAARTIPSRFQAGAAR